MAMLRDISPKKMLVNLGIGHDLSLQYKSSQSIFCAGDAHVHNAFDPEYNFLDFFWDYLRAPDVDHVVGTTGKINAVSLHLHAISGHQPTIFGKRACVTGRIQPHIPWASHFKEPVANAQCHSVYVSGEPVCGESGPLVLDRKERSRLSGGIDMRDASIGKPFAQPIEKRLINQLAANRNLL